MRYYITHSCKGKAECTNRRAAVGEKQAPNCVEVWAKCLENVQCAEGTVRLRVLEQKVRLSAQQCEQTGLSHLISWRHRPHRKARLDIHCTSRPVSDVALGGFRVLDLELLIPRSYRTDRAVQEGMTPICYTLACLFGTTSCIKV